MRFSSRFLAAMLTASAVWLGAPAVADAACAGGSPNGVVETGEQCDTGSNPSAQDYGCTNACTVLESYQCQLTIPFESLTTSGYSGATGNASWSAGVYSRMQMNNTSAPTFAYFGVDASTLNGSGAILTMNVDQATYNGNGLNPSANGSSGGDDDFIGFALGFNPSTLDSSTNRYLLLDWKASTQDGAPIGMRLSLVEGVPALRLTGSGSDSYGRNSDFWKKRDSTSNAYPNSKVRVIAVAQGGYGSSAWGNKVDHQFRFNYTETTLKIETKLANETDWTTVFELSSTDAALSGLFPDGFPQGQIAFYGLSQPRVTYTLSEPLNSICAKNVDITGPATTNYPKPEITGTGSPGASVEVKVGTFTGTTTVNPDGTWSITPTTNLPAGNNTVTAKQNDRGITSTDNFTVNYEPHYIDITTPSDGAKFSSAGSGVYTVGGLGLPGATITLCRIVDPAQPSVCTAMSGVGSATVGANGNWSIDLGSIADGTYAIEATSTITGDTKTDNVTFYVDTVTTGSITAPTNSSTHSSAITTISGDGEPGATVSVTVNGTTFNDVVVNSNGKWSVTINNANVNGNYNVTALFEDTFGNTATATSSFTISACAAANACMANATCTNVANTLTNTCACNAGYVLDGALCVALPVVDITTLVDAIDSNKSNDSTPTFNGTATPNRTVELKIGSTVLGTATAKADGTWSFTPTAPLADGTHTLTATVTIGTATATDTFQFLVDTKTTVTITSPVDGSTVAAPVTSVSGTGEVGAVIKLTIDGSAVTTAQPIVVAANGTWTATLPSPLTHRDTAYEIDATATDALGNTASAQSDVTVTVPLEVAITTPSNDQKPEDKLTNDPTPTITGTATPNADITVVFADANSSVAGCTTKANASGQWSCTVANADELQDGDYDVEVTATSTVDATRKETATDTLTVDTTTQVAITGPANQTTQTNTVSAITGTGEVGGKVTITVNGSPILDGQGDPVTATVGSNGQWSITLPDPLDDGDYDVVATIVDPAFNTASSQKSEFSVVTAIKIRIVAPVATSSVGSPYTDSIDTISGTGSIDAKVVVTITGINGTTYSYTSSPIDVSSGETWSLTLPAGSELFHGSYSIEATIVHNADSTLMNTHTIEIEIDLDTVVAITEVRNSTDALATISQGPIVEVKGTTEAGNKVEVDIKDASGAVVSTGLATVAADGTWTFLLPAEIAIDGQYTITATATNKYNHTATDTTTRVVDTVIEIEITSHVDGEETDLPIASVGGTSEPGASVTVTVDNGDGPQTFGPVTVKPDGSWTLTFPTPLPSGDWEISSTATDAAGNTATDGPITVTVTVNNCTDPSLNQCSDDASCTPTGPGTHTCECNVGFQGDGETCEEIPYVEIEGPADGSTVRTGTPVIEGNGNPNSTVEIIITDGDGATVASGTTTTDGDGYWTWTPDEAEALTEGDFTVTATVDLQNSLGAATDSIEISVDLSTDVIIETPVDGEVVTTQPTISGTAVPNTEVEISVGGTVIGTTTADANGQWNFTIPEEDALPIGPANIVATDTNNGSQDDVDVIVERELVPVTITGPENGSETEDRQPTITGEGEPNTTITIIVNGETVGTTTTDENGNWTWTPDSDLELGELTVIARGADGSKDQITITIVDLTEEPLEIAGGQFFGCNSAPSQAPTMVIVFAAASLLWIARRRREQDAA